MVLSKEIRLLLSFYETKRHDFQLLLGEFPETIALLVEKS